MPLKAASPSPRTRLAPAPVARGASWFVALAAFTLIAVSLGSYFYHRRQLDSIAARHLRLVVAGSGKLHLGVPSVYNLMATTVTGEPWADSVEWSLSTPDGKRLVDRKETTDDRGRLTMIVPADMDLPTRPHGLAQLSVTIGGGANRPSVALPLPVRPARYLTQIWLDRSSYRAGETAYYRSLTVSRYSLVAHRTLPVEFEILDSKSVPLPDSRIVGLTDHGVGNGSFRLPGTLPAGIYTLAVRGLDDIFPEQRLAFEVIGPATPHFQAEMKFAHDGYGPGDDVAAELLLKRSDGKPAAGVSLQVAAKVDDQTIFQKIAKANDGGKLRVEFALPRQLHHGRGQLIVAVEGGDRSDTIAEEIPIRTGTLHVDFYPEGGTLAAGIENRIYFSARDAQGRPLEIHGEIVDGKGVSVSRVETAGGGLGVFSIVPDAGETYRLKISSPAGISGTLPSPSGRGAESEGGLLPPASSDSPITIAAERAVCAPGAPLVFTVHSAKDRLPLVITARVRGVLVGQQMLVASSDPQAKANTVSIPLDDQVAGVLRLTAYDYTKSPPKVLAQRLFYRPPRRLVIRTAEGKKPGAELSLLIQNEKGRPIAAALAVTVLEGAKNKLPSPACRTRQGGRGARGEDGLQPSARCGPDLLHALLANGDFDNPAALEGLDLNLSDADTAADGTRSVPATLLDLVLGCQGSLAGGRAGDARHTQEQEAFSPPLLFDNLGELRAQYQATLNEYRAKRTHVVNALIMLGFFGGLALALLVTMLALLRIVWGSRLWLPTVVATVCCVVVTTVSYEPSRMKPVEAMAVGFAPCVPSLDGESKEQDRSESAVAKPSPADSKLQSLTERLSKAEGEAEDLKSDRFVVRQYTSSDRTRSATGEGGGKPLAWYPLLTAGADGRVTLPGLAPAAGKTRRLIIDACSDGRIESCELLVK